MGLIVYPELELFLYLKEIKLLMFSQLKKYMKQNGLNNQRKIIDSLNNICVLLSYQFKMS